MIERILDHDGLVQGDTVYLSAIKGVLKDAMYDALGKCGTGNMYVAGDTVYQQIFASKNGVLKDLLNPNLQAPEKQAFINWFVAELVKNPELQLECSFPGTQEAFKNMINTGPVVVWTEGDTYESVGMADGTGEQIEKMRGLGLFKIATEEALSRLAVNNSNKGDLQPNSLDGSYVDRVMLAEASISKFSPEVIKRIVNRIRELGLGRAVVLEDRLSNAERMANILNQHGITSNAVWVKQGRHGRKPGYLSEGSFETSDILGASELVEKLKNDNGPVAIICDLDGVLADQEKREELQTQALFNYFKQQGWLQ